MNQRRQDVLLPLAPLRTPRDPDEERRVEEVGGDERRLRGELRRLRQDEPSLLVELRRVAPARRAGAHLALVGVVGAERARVLAQRAFGAVPRANLPSTPISRGKPLPLSTTSTTTTRASAVLQAAPRLDPRARLLLRRETGMAGADAEDPAVTGVLGQSGEPLPEALRRELAAKLPGVDLARVRLHHDSVAGAAARALKARAFTVGEHVYFAGGAFDPTSADGQALLLHELTHVRQFQEGRVPVSTGARVSSPDEPLEREAESVARRGGTAEMATPSPSVSAPAPATTILRAPGDLVEDDAGVLNTNLDSLDNHLQQSAKPHQVAKLAKGTRVRVTERVRVGNQPTGKVVSFGVTLLADGTSLDGKPLKKDETKGYVIEARMVTPEKEWKEPATTGTSTTTAPTGGGLVAGGYATLKQPAMLRKDQNTDENALGGKNQLAAGTLVHLDTAIGTQAFMVTVKDGPWSSPAKQGSLPNAWLTPAKAPASNSVSDEVKIAESIQKQLDGADPDYEAIGRQLDEIGSMTRTLDVLDRISTDGLHKLEPHLHGAPVPVVLATRQPPDTTQVLTPTRDVILQQTAEDQDAIVEYLKRNCDPNVDALLKSLNDGSSAQSGSGTTPTYGDPVAEFRRRLKKKALETLTSNEKAVDEEEAKYADTSADSVAWQRVRDVIVPLVGKYQELGRLEKQYEEAASAADALIKNMEEEGCYVPETNHEGGAPATSGCNSNGGEGYTGSHEKVDPADYDRAKADAKAARKSRDEVSRVRDGIRAQYPIIEGLPASLDILDGGSGTSAENNTSNEALYKQIKHDLFDAVRDACASLRQKISDDDVRLDQFGPLVRQVKEEMGLDQPEQKEAAAKVDAHLADLAAGEAALQAVVGVATVVLTIAAFFTGGTTAVILGLLGAAVGVAGAVHNIDQGSDLYDAANAGMVGEPLVDDPDGARFQFYLALAELVLAGMDLKAAMSAAITKVRSGAAATTKKTVTTTGGGTTAPVKAAVVVPGPTKYATAIGDFKASSQAHCLVDSEALGRQMFRNSGQTVRPDRWYNGQHWHLRVGDDHVDSTIYQFFKDADGPVFEGSAKQLRETFNKLYDAHGPSAKVASLKSGDEIFDFAYGGAKIKNKGEDLVLTVGKSSGKTKVEWPEVGAAKIAPLKSVEMSAADLAERKRVLGTDPKRGYLEHEGAVGAEIEGRYGGFDRDPSGAGEWISQSGPDKGKVYDLLGIPPGKTKFHSDKLEKFLPSVDSHFRKSIDYVVLDVRNMTAEQKKTVMKYIDDNWAAQKSRLIVLE